MCSTITLRDIVCVRVHLFLVSVIPLHSDLNRHIVISGRDTVKHVVQWLFVKVQELDKGAQTALVPEFIAPAAALITNPD